MFSMNISILVRSGFGKIMRDSSLLNKSERDRLTSRTQGPEKNLEVEFEIEKDIRTYGENLGIVFCETEDLNTPNITSYGFKQKGLLFQEEKELIDTLRLPTPKTKIFSPINEDISFPFILKNPESRKGREVYLVENFEMVEKIRSFLESSLVFIPSLGGEIFYDPTFEREKLIYQEYIETPSDYFTTYRVLISCTGTIFASRLNYSENTKDSLDLLVPQTTTGWHKRDILISKDSPFYLSSKKVVSNQSANGGGIVLDPLPTSKKPSVLEEEILTNHNLDPFHPSLPVVIRDYSIAIAKYLGSRKKGLIFGIDWIQSKDDQFYYLETNLSPGSKSFIDTHQSGIGTHEEAMRTMFHKILKDITEK